ncbi:MAG: UDP-N-acetylmuramate dehydrogenase [Candidatus Azambacteria bacterium]|nr:UDP-N-acetylmuramate dehydrogenase [Candidatus Azambacteria bacterium]
MFDPSLFQENISLKEYNTYRVGGLARYFYIARDADALTRAVRHAQENNSAYFILGGGTNILIPDEGFSGVVIKAEHQRIDVQDDEIYADAGIPMGALVAKASSLSLSGLEWAAGLPGTLGGAIFGNAGSHGGETKNIISEVEVFDPMHTIVRRLSARECDFRYRHSAFKERGGVIIGATLRLRKGDAAEITTLMKENMQKRIAHQPLAQRSAGCVFKNIELATSREGEVLARSHADFMTFHDASFLPAGLLIDKAGLKGSRVGGAMISDVHGNFIVNDAHATADDIISLIATTKKGVQEKFGVQLQEEVRIIQNKK